MSDIERYEERIEELERENASLKKEVALLKKKQKRGRDDDKEDTTRVTKKEKKEETQKKMTKGELKKQAKKLFTQVKRAVKVGFEFTFVGNLTQSIVFVHRKTSTMTKRNHGQRSSWFGRERFGMDC